MAKKKTGSAAAATAKPQSVVRVEPHYRDAETVASDGSGYQKWLLTLQEQLESIQPGRILRVDLSTAATPSPASTAPSSPAVPRYTVTIVDHSPARSNSQPNSAAAAASSNLSCGVLILSQGREHDWLFSHREGQQSLCRQHSFHRLLLVALNRGHTFTSLQQVQDEIRGSVASLLPAKERRGAVPFLALSADIGGRREVAVLPTDANGEVVVEDVRAEDGRWIRQLLFVNIGMVQSEARLVASKPSKSNTPPPVASPIDFAYLPSGYHQSFLAALSLLPTPPSSILLVGVGAGSLAMFISCVLPLCSLTLVELDGAILRVAESYFGFHPSDRMTVRIMDGLEYIAATAAAASSGEPDSSGPYDVVCVDCNSGDLSEGLTFPPPAFVSPATLSATHSLCQPSSLYLLNFGCRSAAKRESVVLSLLDRWDELYEVEVGEEDITNTVLAARRVERSESAAAAPLTSSACQGRLINKRRSAEWRQQARESGEQLRPFEWDDDMDLTDKCANIQQISRQLITQHSVEVEEAKEPEGLHREGAVDSGAERWEVIIKPLPPGGEPSEADEDADAAADAEGAADEAELSAAERKRAKARAKRARQKAKARGR